jgi:sugar phosphate isomerase/epimerase
MNETEMKSAITFSAVPETQGGPFVYWGSLEESMRSAKELGFDAIEIFPPSPEFFRTIDAAKLAQQIGLEIAAVGTGAGWLKHKLSLADADPQVRARAMEFLSSMLVAATQLQAPMIIGSMQGRSGPGGLCTRPDARHGWFDPRGRRGIETLGRYRCAGLERHCRP